MSKVHSKETPIQPSESGGGFWLPNPITAIRSRQNASSELVTFLSKYLDRVRVFGRYGEPGAMNAGGKFGGAPETVPALQNEFELSEVTVHVTGIIMGTVVLGKFTPVIWK